MIETPSLITVDNYKTNSLNNLNLQLHASTEVSNPYTFKITSNVKFGVDSIEPDCYTLTVGTDNGNIWGYMDNICGDITPKTYQSYTITGLYVDIVRQILYFTSTVDGKFAENPTITVTNTTDDANNLKYGISLTYKSTGYYAYISIEDILVFENATTPLKIKIEP